MNAKRALFGSVVHVELDVLEIHDRSRTAGVYAAALPRFVSKPGSLPRSAAGFFRFSCQSSDSMKILSG